MTKVLFLMPRLGNGGAEKIACYLANELSSLDNYEVKFLLLDRKRNEYLDLLDEKISIEYLDLKNRFRSCIHKVIKKIISLQPDIFFIGYDTLNLYMAPFIPVLKRYGIKVIVRETNILSKRFKPTLFKKMIYKTFYNNYDTIICQSKDMADDLINNWKIKTSKINIINNPINVEIVQEKSLTIKDTLTNNLYFVAVGRLSSQKGFGKLIELIGYLEKKNKFPYKLLIMGEGELRESLEADIKKRNLTEKIQLIGRVDNPYPIMVQSLGLILSSDFEGFPNVLLEANALGLPVFSNRCPGGINEIIEEGINGVTANFNDKEDFECKFDKFIKTQFNKKDIIALTKSRYDVSIIFPKYQQLFMLD